MTATLLHAPSTVPVSYRQLPPASSTHGELAQQPARWKGKRAKTSIDTESSNNSDRERPVKAVKLTVSHFIDTNKDQEERLQLFLRQWEQNDHLPTDKELKEVATVCKLSVTKVAMWYGDKMRFRPQSPASNPSMPPPNANDNPESYINQDIARYVDEAKRKDCSSPHSRNAGGGHLFCTWGCGFSTPERDAWERHEWIKQPQYFWHCAICREEPAEGSSRKTFITYRIDKFLPHAQKRHSSENAQELRRRSKVEYSGSYERTCKFKLRSTGKKCKHRFTSWQQRCNHYIAHFNNEIGGGPWHLPNAPGPQAGAGGSAPRAPGGRSAGPNGSSGSGSSNQAKSASASPSGSSGGGTSRSSQNTGAAVLQTSREFAALPAAKTSSPPIEASSIPAYVCYDGADRPDGSRALLDVHHLRLMRVSYDTEYLALLSPGSVKAIEDGSNLSTLQLDLAKLHIPELRRFPFVLQKAILLTREMGFQYLWAKSLCQHQQSFDAVDGIYQRAALVLIIVPSHEPDGKLRHFTCPASRMDDIMYWAETSVSFQHVQHLGHGAYSHVDEVVMQSTREVFARKIVYRTNSKRPLTIRPSKEMEIMQKLSHPHIAQFIAAYYDNCALNILMTPVADCDLRRYLSYPSDFPDKHGRMRRWFMSLAEAVAYMHRNCCRHKDIKPANILIKGHNVLLTDFGTSLDFSNSASRSTGPALMTPKYTAPEVAAQQERGTSADVFSLGCVFAEMITVDLGRSVEDLNGFLEIGDSSDRRATYHGQFRRLIKWLSLLDEVSPDKEATRILGTCKSMLQKEPKLRPTALQVVQALCSNKRCSGYNSGSVCHCCPGESSLTLHRSLAMKHMTSMRAVPMRKARFNYPLLWRVLLSSASIARCPFALRYCKALHVEPREPSMYYVMLDHLGLRSHCSDSGSNETILLLRWVDSAQFDDEYFEKSKSATMNLLLWQRLAVTRHATKIPSDGQRTLIQPDELCTYQGSPTGCGDLARKDAKSSLPEWEHLMQMYYEQRGVVETQRRRPR